MKLEDSTVKMLDTQPPNLLISIGFTMLYTDWYFISLTSTFTDWIDSNKGISNPLCSKKGLICWIKGFTVNLISSSIFSNIFSVLVKNIGLSKSTRG